MWSKFCGAAMIAVVAVSMAACDGGLSSPPAPTVKLTSSATDVAAPGAVVTMTWLATHATACMASGDWSHPQGTDGSEGVLVRQTSTYTLSCSGRGGVVSASVTVHVWSQPAVSLKSDFTSVLPATAVLLTWSATDAATCRGVSGLSGTLPTSGSQTSAPLTETTTFSIECANPVFGEASSAAVVTVAIPKFTVLELPMAGAIDLNDLGDVVGYRPRQPADGWTEPVVWLAGGTVEVLGCSTPPVCYRYFAVAMNDNRTVIGRNRAVSYMQWTGFRWQVGDAVVYPVSIQSPMNIEDINDAGQIVGGGPGPGAMLIAGSTSIWLFGTQGSNSMASAINDAGHITGYVVPGTDQVRHVFLYADGTIRDLGTMNGVSSDAVEINMVDEIVGSAGGHAFLYATSAFRDLGTLGGASSSAAGINDAGQVVGASTLDGPDPQVERAFWYVDGAMHDLNELAAPLSARLSEARKINNQGQIIANACAPPDYATDCRAYLLTPVSPP